MHVLLVTGFLGSGKTTVIVNVIRNLAGMGEKRLKTAVLVNEIGAAGIDNQFMNALDFNVRELVSGCICCNLSADLLENLHNLEREVKPDLVIIEPSGASDPRNILETLRRYAGPCVRDIKTLAVLDSMRLDILMEVMTPLITAQIECADMILISKADLADEEQTAYARLTAHSLNPCARIIDRNHLTPDFMSEGLLWPA